MPDSRIHPPWQIGDYRHDTLEVNDRWSVPIWANSAPSGDKIAAEAIASDRETALERAMLIAAAPELLEACEAAIKDYPCYCDDEELDGVCHVCVCRSAIDKALIETPTPTVEGRQ